MAVQPYDWRGYLQRRVYDVAPQAPLEGINQGGYRLIFADEPTKWWRQGEKDRKATDLTYSGGFVVGSDGQHYERAVGRSCVQRRPVGRRPGPRGERPRLQWRCFEEAIKAANGQGPAVQLLVKAGDVYRTVSLDWHGGLRYPRLEKVGKGQGHARRAARAALI